MAVRIRLTRVGATKRPAYRVIAIDKRRSRDGRALEILGYYDPLTEPATVRLDTAKIQAWIGKGAQPSDTVVKLMRQSERDAAAETTAEKPKRATRSAARPSKKSQAKAAPETAPEAADASAADASLADEVAVEAPPASDSPTAPGMAEADTATAEEPTSDAAAEKDEA